MSKHEIDERRLAALAAIKCAGFSGGLAAELFDRVETSLENPDDPADMPPDHRLYYAAADLYDDGHAGEPIPATWRATLRLYFISLGVFREITDDELDRTYVTRGRKHDFTLAGVKYVFDRHPDFFMS